MGSINIKSEQLMQNITSLINNSELPISNVYYIFKILIKDLENVYYMTLNKESQEQTETKEMSIEKLEKQEKSS